MRCLSFEQCAAWSEEHRYPIQKSDGYGYPYPDLPRAFRELRLKYPVESGLKVGLAREVMQHLCTKGEVLVWVDEWSVWPYRQHMPMFARFREALGETRLIIDAPGHLLACDEREDATSILAMSLLFDWDCYVLPAEQSYAFKCSHDDWCAFYVPHNDTPPWLLEAFGNTLLTGRAGERIQ